MCIRDSCIGLETGFVSEFCWKNHRMHYTATKSVSPVCRILLKNNIKFMCAGSSNNVVKVAQTSFQGELLEIMSIIFLYKRKIFHKNKF